MTRRFLVWVHRWVGLLMAAFLIVVGATGSLLAFFPELNHWLTPDIHPGLPAVMKLDAAALARRAEAIVPQARATAVYYAFMDTVMIGMEAQPNAPPLDFDQLYLDPVSGEELGRLTWGALPKSPKEIMPFIYSLHYSLALGNVGMWVLGILAIAWTIDCFVGFYLTLPLPARSNAHSFFARWKPAWRVKLGSSVYRINFDLHRAGGLWLWAMLLIVAWSSVYMNMDGFYTRAMRLFFDYDSTLYFRTMVGEPRDDREPMNWEEAQTIAERLMDEQARAHRFAVLRPMSLSIDRASGLYSYRVRSSRDIGDKYGQTAVWFDAYSGALRTLDLPTGQRAANTVTSWMFELHKANVFGLPYKIFVSAFGLVVVMLSITGVYIWWKKRWARLAHVRRAAARDAPAE